MAEDELTNDLDELEDESAVKTLDPRLAVEHVPEDPVGPAAHGDELMPVIREGAWVILGDSKSVPKELHGELAAVIGAQILKATGTESNAHSPSPYEYQNKDCLFTVRTRGQAAIVANLKRKDFAKVTQDGRHVLEQRG